MKAASSPPEERISTSPGLFSTGFLLVASLFVSIVVTRLANAPVLDVWQWLPLAVFVVVLVGVSVVLRVGRYRGDGPLPGLALTLSGIGLAVQVRIGVLQVGADSSVSQFAFPLGVVVLLGTWMLFRGGRHRRLERFWFPSLLVALVAVAVVLVFGRRYRGAHYFPGNMNPVDVIKPLLVIFLAAHLSGNRAGLRRGFLGIPLPPLNVVVTVALLWAVPMGLLLVQGDLGLIALMNAVALVMLYAATHRIAYLLGGGVLVVLAVRFAVPLFATARRRFEAWRDPFSAATGSGWQILQGLVALYSGGLLGAGIGAGSPRVVPIVESDFVYVLLGEELGYIGCLVLMLLYLALAVRGFGIAARARDPYASLVATGLTSCIVVQTLLNVGGVTKAIPLTGITLPFISHGGSSLVTFMGCIGLLMAISEPEPERDRD